MLAYFYEILRTISIIFSPFQNHPNSELIGASFDNALFFSDYLLGNAVTSTVLSPSLTASLATHLNVGEVARAVLPMNTPNPLLNVDTSPN
ncbi:MAG: hypothetical protein IPK76_02390 [Lewinellaceae bacterium]|nr:hypothetical protein [Lewinellaceae bacterium]